MSPKQSFRKSERLCSKKLADKLFNCGESFLMHPIRVGFMEVSGDDRLKMEFPLQVLIAVQRKKIKSAVKRNRIKRLMRECWRKHKYQLIEELFTHNKYLVVALTYIDENLPEYHQLCAKIISIIHRLIHTITQMENHPCKS